MLSVIILYFLGKRYYKLAEFHGRSKWGFAILGVACYYVGAIVSATIFAIAYDMLGYGLIDDLNDYLLGLIGLPFGILAWWLVFKYIERRFEGKGKQALASDLLDDGMLNSVK